MSDKNWPDHYRYESFLNETGVIIALKVFKVIGETNNFYYVIKDTDLKHSCCYSEQWKQDIIKRCRRRVSKDGRSRICYPSKEDALRSFMFRQGHRIHFAQRNISIASIGAKKAEELLQSRESLECDEILAGHDEYTEGLIYE